MILGICEQSSFLGVLYYIKAVLEIIRIIVPLILLLFTGIEIYRIVVGKIEDGYKHIKSIIYKFIAMIVIFIFPSFVSMVLSIIDGSRIEESLCWENANKTTIASYRKSEEEQKKKEEAEREEEKKKKEEERKKIEEEREKKRQENEKKAEEERKKRSNQGDGAGAANSISDKTDYENKTLNVTKAVDVNINNPLSSIGNGRNEYRAAQAGVYTGNYVVYAQNKNYGGIDASSKGGRICWSNLYTGAFVKCIEIGAEGGHMDGLAYDNDRGYILKVGDKRLIQIDNQKREIVGYVKADKDWGDITYVPSIHSLVQLSGGVFTFQRYNSSTNKYEAYKTVPLQNYDSGISLQGIGTDGTNIFIADSSPSNNRRHLYTYSLDGRLLEKHNMGSGFGSMSNEIETAFADNEGTLYLVCPQGIAKVLNYTANKIGLPK